jgi:hypothetical protein
VAEQLEVLVARQPLIHDGLLRAVAEQSAPGDRSLVRGGLYILRYTGPHWQEVADIHFLEGNSNLGDAVQLASGQSG